VLTPGIIPSLAAEPLKHQKMLDLEDVIFTVWEHVVADVVDDGTAERTGLAIEIGGIGENGT
jgi:hypothetical protein